MILKWTTAAATTTTNNNGFKLSTVLGCCFSLKLNARELHICEYFPWKMNCSSQQPARSYTLHVLSRWLNLRHLEINCSLIKTFLIVNTFCSPRRTNSVQSGVNTTNILCTDFTYVDHKKAVKSSVILRFLDLRVHTSMLLKSSTCRQSPHGSTETLSCSLV